ncbi:dephospho-CoA kinase [Candidatus Saccharibacteria bacterium]|nr:dephospho-CoA kinase [Candidatus Saccharibacteria bacterium]
MSEKTKNEILNDTEVTAEADAVRDSGSVKIVAIVGMSGSGKSVAVDYLTALGYPKVYFGGMILKGLEKAGLEVNEQNEKNFREQIRKTEGKDWVVRQVIDEVYDLMRAGQKRIVLDGVYSWTEYKTLKHEFPGMLTFIAIVVNKKLRHKRVGKRQVRPLTVDEVNSRDTNEIENLEKGGPIAAADYFVLNNGSMEKLEKDLQQILDEIKFN